MRPANIDYRGKIIQKTIEIENLSLLTRRYETSLFAILLTIFKLSIHRYTNASDIIIGIPVSVRKCPEQENEIGYYLNSLPIRSIVSPDLHTDIKENKNLYNTVSYDNYLNQVKTKLIEGLKNKDIPFENIVNELRIQRDISRHPIFQIMFNYWQDDKPKTRVCNSIVVHPSISYQNEGKDRLKFPLSKTIVGINKKAYYKNNRRSNQYFELEDLNVFNGNSKFDLTLHIKVNNSTLLLTYEYREGLYHHEDIIELSNTYERSIRDLINGAFTNSINKNMNKTKETTEQSTNTISRREFKQTLIDIWKQLLQQDQVSIHDNFFDIGGNSFMIIQMQHMIIKKLNINLRTIDLFAYPSISELYKYVESEYLDKELSIQEI